MDKTKILEILNDWNYWNKELPDTNPRSLYDDKISSFLDSDEIVVIKGIRRSGKSTLMINQVKRLIKSGVKKEDILIVNLEDPRFINHLNLELLEKIKETYLEYLNPSAKPYIFLDEVQNIPDWENWVNKEYELSLSKLIITGSNSSMLSSEIASTLSGRYLSLEVYPLSFSEYLDFLDIEVKNMLEFIDKKIDIKRAFESYLRDGGFPKVVKIKDSEKRELLTTYKDSILLKDIVARYRLKNFHILEDLSAFLLSNSGIVQSINRLKNNFSISYDMASSYVEYLKSAYMLFEVKKFDYSLKKQTVNDKKYYSIDLGISNLFRVANLQTRGRDLETVVFLELKRRGYKIYYYKTSNDLECDFLLQKDDKIHSLVQVSKTLKDEKTKLRELRVFSKVIDELALNDVNLLVICEDETTTINFEDKEVKIVNILQWLKDF